jgi:hypothetical protein
VGKRRLGITFSSATVNTSLSTRTHIQIGNQATGSQRRVRRGEPHQTLTIDVVHTNGLEDLSLCKVSDTDLGHDGDRDSLHDVLDELRVGLERVREVESTKLVSVDAAARRWVAERRTIRATPPSFRINEGIFSRTMMAAAPASSARMACSLDMTSMMTPPGIRRM